MITTQQAEEVGGRFGCCSFAYLVRAMNYEIVGESSRSEIDWSNSLKAFWGARVMQAFSKNTACFSAAYAEEVANSVDCICKPNYGCECPEDDCEISIDSFATTVDCGAPIDAWVFSGAGDVGMNEVLMLPSAYIPEATPGSTVYSASGYTLYNVIDFGFWAVALTSNIADPLYVSFTLGSGAWFTLSGVAPAPTQRQSVVAELCSTALTPEERIALAVPSPEQGLYLFDCCGDDEFFEYSEEEGGFDYGLDFGLN